MLDIASQIERHLPTPIRCAAARHRRRRAPLNVSFDPGFPSSDLARALAREIAAMVWARHLPRAGDVTIAITNESSIGLQGLKPLADVATDPSEPDRIVIAPAALVRRWPARSLATALILTVATETMRLVRRRRRRTQVELDHPPTVEQLEIEAHREASEVLRAILPAGYDLDGEPFWIVTQSPYAPFVTASLLALVDRAESEGEALITGVTATPTRKKVRNLA